jgi:hypothetical protein
MLAPVTREDAVPKWLALGEPSLDELLDDEIMHFVLRADGLDVRELRRRLAEIARRLAEPSAIRSSGCRPAFC